MGGRGAGRGGLGLRCSACLLGSYLGAMPGKGSPAKGASDDTTGEATVPSMLLGHCWGVCPGACSPAGPVGEHNIAVLVCALQEGDTGVPLPVPHGLPEYRSLAACRTKKAAVPLSRGLHPLPHQQVPGRQGQCCSPAHLPVKLPPMTKGMTPSGHTRSGLDVAARRLRDLLPLLSWLLL